MSNIHILSEPIHSGKTTMLMDWCNRQQSIAGVLMPDVNGMRKLYDIGTKTYHDLQVEAEEKEGITRIGKFYFEEKVFQLAQELLLQAAEQQPEWLVLDEIGRLEMNMNGGFEPAASALTQKIPAKYGECKTPFGDQGLFIGRGSYALRIE